MGLLTQALNSFGIDCPSEQEAQFERYYELLLDWNERINLTAIVEREEVVYKHFVDSVLPIALLAQGASVCDVGTGAGFPGIPLKILRPDLRLTLVDSLQKRVTFLEAVKSELNLTDVRCVHARAEELGRSVSRETFDVVTSRAVARLATLCEYALPLVRVGGCFLAYKARAEEELAESGTALRILGGTLREARHYEYLDCRRTVLVVDKTAPTPKRYPRGKGKERSEPIR